MLELAEKFFGILFSFLIFGQAYLISRMVGTYLIPAALFSLAWFFFTIIPLTFLFGMPINPLSILFILICVSAFSLSSLPFNWTKAFKNNKFKTTDDYNKFNSKLIHYFFYISFLSSIIFNIFQSYLNGFDLNGILFYGGEYARRRGMNELTYNVFGRLSTFFIYMVPILGGFIAHHQKNKVSHFKFLILSFTPALFVMLTQSGKLQLFVSFGFYIASIFLMKVYSNKLELLSKKSFFKFIFLALLVLPLVSISILQREVFLDFGNLKTFERLFTLLLSYTCGQIYAFSDFFSNYLGFKTEINYIHTYNSYGLFTFRSISDLIRTAHPFPVGIFEDSFSYSNGIATNIFTIFRGLIYDFGLVGTICFMFIFGLVIHAFFYRLLFFRNSFLACASFIITVVFIQFSYLMSLFMARYAFLILGGLFIILWANNKYCKKTYSHE